MTGKGHRSAVVDLTNRRAPAWALSILILGAAGYCSLFLSAVTSRDGELLQALTIAPILVALTVPIALRLARRDGDPTLVSIVMAGIVAKLLGAWIRHWVAYDYYGGNADSLQYDMAGRLLAPNYRQFDFTTNIGSLIGTGFIKMFTGVVYAIFGMSRVGGFLVFGWISFMGLILLASAFRIGVPTGNPRRYLIAVLFVPSLVYWPSSIGKEAWMMLALGLTSYGVAGLLQRRSGGLPALALGLLALLAVRPHIALIVFVGIALALLLRRAPARSYAAPLFRVLGIAALIVIGLVLISRTASFLGQPTLTADSVSQELSNTQEQTTDGGSAFTPVQVNSPIDLVPATVTVLFRPFPFEVSSVAELVSAAEGALLIFLLVRSRRRIRSLPSMIRTTPYVTYCLGYLLGFVYAFSAFANFGILARQRSQALPFVLVLLALPEYGAVVGGTPTTDTVASVDTTAVPRGRRRRRAQAETASRVQAVPKPGSLIAGTEGVRRRNRRPVEPAVRAPVSSSSAFPPPPRVHA